MVDRNEEIRFDLNIDDRGFLRLKILKCIESEQDWRILVSSVYGKKKVEPHAVIKFGYAPLREFYFHTSLSNLKKMHGRMTHIIETLEKYKENDNDSRESIWIRSWLITKNY